jgi:CheY-like chemotaxis protein
MHVRLVEKYCKTCTQAADGLECLQLVEAAMAQNEVYDCILLDSAMPNMTGPEVTIRLRQMNYKGRILGVTGNARQSDIDEFLASGVDKVILKPIKSETITEIINEIMSTRRAKWVMTKLKDQSTPGHSLPSSRQNSRKIF